MSLVKTDLKQIYEFYICEVSYSKEKGEGKKKPTGKPNSCGKMD